MGGYHSLINGRVLPPNSEKITILRVSRDSAEAPGVLMQRLRESIVERNLDVRVCYCSVYDECWTARMHDVVGRAQGVAVPSSRPAESCETAPSSGI